MHMNQGVMRAFFLWLAIVAGTHCRLSGQDPNSGNFTDTRDGHSYKWVKIGTQEWMAENLAYLPEVSLSSATSIFQKHYYVYDYEGTDVSQAKRGNYKKCGVLYNWASAVEACPYGWHLPTDAEWKALEKFLGMDPSDADQEDIRETGSVAVKLKSGSGWALKTANGDNSNVFNALPCGYRYQTGGFYHLGYGAYFWSATQYNTGYPWNRSLDYAGDGLRRLHPLGNYGYSVRCLRN